MPLRMQTQQLVLEGHEFVFDLPVDQDEMLEHALVGEASGTSDWDPYWGLLWAAAPKTAQLLLRRTWPAGLRAIELGCGIGLTGIAGLKCGLEVTFADHSSEAVSIAVQNAARNGFPKAVGATFDWNDPPALSFPFAFASDVLYDARGHQPLLKTLNAILPVDGVAWIGDAGRINAPRFADLAENAGWAVSVFDEQFQPCAAPTHMQFRVMELTRKS